MYLQDMPRGAPLQRSHLAEKGVKYTEMPAQNTSAALTATTAP